MSDVATDAFAPGALIAKRYELVRTLGEGGMGTVYEAIHTELSRRVAVKVLRPEFSADRVAVERFRAEARTASALRHRNVVEVIDFGDDAGRLFLVMELLDGESLQALLYHEGALAAERAIALAEPVLSALSWAHARGVVHRDVKPDNVFLARIPGEAEVVPKLLDFGIARGERAGEAKLTQTGVMLGTPAYMAPEQAWNTAPLTPSADQWSSAAMLYEMLSGRIPHESDNLSVLVAKRVSQDADDLAKLRPSLPSKLCSAVMRALSREVTARFDSIDAFREALRDGLRDAPSAPIDPPINTAPPPARPAGLDATAEAPPHEPPPVEAPPVEAPPAPPFEAPSTPVAEALVTPPTVTPKRRSVWIVAALSVVAIVGALSISRTPTAPTPAPLRALASVDAALAEVVFTVNVTPASARITIDDAYQGVARAAVRKPRDGRRHTLRVEAPGFAPYSDVLRADTDLSLTIQLTAEPVAPGGATTNITRSNTAPRVDHGASPRQRLGARRIDTELPP